MLFFSVALHIGPVDGLQEDVGVDLVARGRLKDRHLTTCVHQQPRLCGIVVDTWTNVKFRILKGSEDFFCRDNFWRFVVFR